METVQLSGIPLVTKFRLLLPGWSGTLCADQKGRTTAWRTPSAVWSPSALHAALAPPKFTGSQGASKVRALTGTTAPPRLPTRRGSLHATPTASLRSDSEVQSRQGASSVANHRGSVVPTAVDSCADRIAPAAAASAGAGGSGNGSDGGALRARSRAKLAQRERSNVGRAGSGSANGDWSGGRGIAGFSAAVWSQVRGADVATWAELVQRHGTTLGGAFAANALFRAAHFVDGAGALLSAGNDSGGRTSRLGASTPPAQAAEAATDAPSAPVVEAANFSALVHQLLGPATEAAVAGQLDGTRSCRLLWALAKLSGGGSGASVWGSANESGTAGQDERRVQGSAESPAHGEGQGGTARPEGVTREAWEGVPTLPRRVMRGELGGRCVEAVAAHLVRQLAEDNWREAAAGRRITLGGDGHSDSPHAVSASASTSAPDQDDGEGVANVRFISSRGPGGAIPVGSRQGGGGSAQGLTGRVLVMAMWGLARLTSEGHLRYRSALVAGGASGAGGVEDPDGYGYAISRDELWGALCSALRSRLVGLQAREVSNALWALSSARYFRHPVFEELVTALEPHLKAAAEVEGEAALQRRPVQGSCNVQDLVNAVWALARSAASFNEGLTSQRLLGLCESAVLCVLPQLWAQHVASLLWSFTTIRYRPTRHVIIKIPATEAGAAAVYGLEWTRAAATGAGSCPSPGSRQQQQALRPSQQVSMNLYQLLGRRAWELQLFQKEDAGVVAQVVWALVRERVVDEKVLRVAARRLQVGADGLTLREAAMVASAYRTARFANPGLFEALLRRAGALPQQELLRSPHADVSIVLLLRGLAWSGCYDASVYTRLCDALRHYLPSIQPQPLALALWALAEVQHRQLDFLSPATTMAAAIVGRFSGGELSCVALSLARLGVCNADFFGAAAVTLTALRGGGAAAGEAAATATTASELVPGEAAPVSGEESDEELEEDDEDEEEDIGEEDQVGGDEGPVVSSYPAAASWRRRRRRGGTRYWLPRASVALHSYRWRRIDLLNPQELANVMAAFAISGHVDELLYYRAQIRTRRLLNASAVLRREAAAAAARGGTGGSGSSAAAAALRRGDPVSGDDMSAAAISKLLWAFVAVGVQEPPLLLALANRLRQQLQRLEPRDIAALAWALAVTRLPDCEDLLSRAVRAASEHARAFTPADLATVAWSAATVGVLNLNLMDACARLVMEASAKATPTFAITDAAPALKVLSDVAWAHSALRLYHPRLLQRVAALAEVQLTAAPGAQLREVAPWMPPDLELQHVVALLEAYATWAAGPIGSDGDGGSGYDCYHDGLFQAAAAVLLSRLDELTIDEVVTLTWCCAAVLHVLPPPPPLPLRTQSDATGKVEQLEADPHGGHHHHPVLELLTALSNLIAATPHDSFLQPELAQLAQAHAMSVQYGALAATTMVAAAGGRQVQGPLMVPPVLMQRMVSVWGSAPALRTRRLVVELCAALEEMGFEDIQIDTRSEDGLLPVDVGAVGPPPPMVHPFPASPPGNALDSRKPGMIEGGHGAADTHSGSPGVSAGGKGHPRRYAFLVMAPDLQVVGQPHVYWGPLAVRVRLLKARGWETVVVPIPTPAAAGVGRRVKGRVDASQQRQYVRELLSVVLQGRP